MKRYWQHFKDGFAWGVGFGVALLILDRVVQAIH